MNIEVLTRFWQQTLQGSAASPGEWNEQVSCIYQCGKGLEETLRYLYNQRPTFEGFLQWMAPAGQTADNEIFAEDVLTAGDMLFFNENGFVVISNAITRSQADDAKNAILEYLRADINDPESWYKNHDDKRGLMLMFYHHPALQVVRNSVRVRRAYEQLYATNQITGVVDKVSFNPPVTPQHAFTGSLLHWDVSLVPPIPFALQGLLYFNDVEANGGAFSCVPGFNNQLEQWLANLPPGVNPREEALRTLQPVPVPGNAGDFIIWHQGLPHCATANRSSTPRFVQYHTYLPHNLVVQKEWR
jgi:ectoine hydroxylase-related dioxygenase (phytanoyl-CoA dioxygenase family)